MPSPPVKGAMPGRADLEGAGSVFGRHDSTSAGAVAMDLTGDTAGGVVGRDPPQSTHQGYQGGEDQGGP